MTLGGDPLALFDERSGCGTSVCGARRIDQAVDWPMRCCCVEGEFLDTVIGIPDSCTEIVMLRPLDGGTRPELSSFVRPEPGNLRAGESAPSPPKRDRDKRRAPPRRRPTGLQDEPS